MKSFVSLFVMRYRRARSIIHTLYVEQKNSESSKVLKKCPLHIFST